MDAGRQSPSEARRARICGENFEKRPDNGGEERPDNGGEGTNVVESLESPVTNEGGFKVDRARTGEVDRAEAELEGGSGLPLFELLSPDCNLRKLWIDDGVDRAEVDPAKRTAGGLEESNLRVLSFTLLLSDRLSMLSVVSLASEVALQVLASESFELPRFSVAFAMPGRAFGLGLGDREYLLWGIVVSQRTSSTTVTSDAFPSLHRPLHMRSP